MVYDGVPCVTMPVGRSRELMTFSKDNLLQELNLPSSRHLQLAAILTKNDYFEGISMYGIKSNADVVRNISLEHQGEVEDCKLVSKFQHAILEYLDLIENVDLSLDKFNNAISAFVLCREDQSESAKSSPQTHEEVCKILRRLEDTKLRRKGLLPQSQPTPSNVASSSANRLIDTEFSHSWSMTSPTINGNVQQNDHPSLSPRQKTTERKLERWRSAR